MVRAPSSRSSGAAPASGRTAPAVTAFLRDLDHPLKAEIETVRHAILAVDPAIGEAIKWNAPSFRTHEFFATFFLRERECVRLVLHRGARSKDDTKRLAIADPAGLLEWRATDRCLVTLGKGKDVAPRLPALQAIVNAWIAAL